MNIIEQVLQKQKVLILDGALGTQIQKKGYNVNDSLWSAKFLDENPEVIKEVHKEYLQAGADCLITSTYQASIEGFLEKKFSLKRAKELIKLSVEIAKQSVDEFYKDNKQNRMKPLVAASIGPYGAYLADGSEYDGKYKISNEELKMFHKKRLEIIMETKPDIFACETIPSFNEAVIISELLKEYSVDSSWISFSAKDENTTNANDDIVECMKYFQNQEHISAVGINCTKPQYIPQLIENIKSVCTKPIVVYPNGGSKYNPLTKKWEKGGISASEYAKLSHLWYSKGAKLIGGCCETSPEDIKAIRKVLFS